MIPLIANTEVLMAIGSTLATASQVPDTNFSTLSVLVPAIRKTNFIGIFPTSVKENKFTENMQFFKNVVSE